MRIWRPRSQPSTLFAYLAIALLVVPLTGSASRPRASTPAVNAAHHHSPLAGPQLLANIAVGAFPVQHGFGDRRFGVVEAYERPALADDLHVGWERVQIRWDLLQPKGPLQWDVNATSNPHFPTADGPFNHEIARGRQLVGVIQGVPAWATTNPTAGNGAVPRNIDLPWNDPRNYWGQFVFRAARHYAGRIDTLVILNEVNIKTGNYYQFAGTVTQYAQMLRVAYLAAHAANPHVELHMYGDSVYADGGTWFGQLLQILAGFPDAHTNNLFFDAVEMHLYSSIMRWDTLVGHWRDLMSGYGLTKPIWMTETNVAPRDDYVAPALPANHNTPLSIQPYFLVDSFAVGLGLGMPRLEVYRMLDPQHIFPEHPSGLARRDGSVRPEYTTFKVMNDWFSGVDASRYEPCNAPYIDKFCLFRVVMERPASGTHPAQELQVVWNQGGRPGAATIPAVAPHATIVLPDGHTSTVDAVGGDYKLPLQTATDHAIDNPKAFKIGGLPLIVVQDLPTDTHVPGLRAIPTETDRSTGAGTALGAVTSVAIDPSGTGIRVVADTAHDRVLIENANGTLVKEIGGTGGAPGQFRGPAGVAIGADGTLYVTDQGNARIQEFDLSGRLLGGFGTYEAGIASLKAPTAIAVSPRDNTLYVSDAAQDAVLHFTRMGDFLGRWGTFGYGTNQFDGIGGLGVDAAGHVYVADTLNNRVVEFGSTGNLLTQIGTGAADGGASSLHWPTALSILPTGGIAVADADNGRVVLVTHPQTYVDGMTIDGVSAPGGLAVASDGSYFVTDTAENRVVHLDAQGHQLGAFGSKGFGAGQFFNPLGLAIDAHNTLYVADSGNNRIEVMTTDGHFIRHIGRQGHAPGQFLGPRAVSVDSDGSLWVADTANGRLQHLGPGGALLGISVTGINGVWGVAADGQGGAYYSAHWGQRLYHWNPRSAQEVWGAPGSGAGEFNHPGTLVVADGGSTIYVVDEGNSRIQYLSGGRFGGQRGSADTGASGLGDPVAVAVRHDGSIAVLDAARHRLALYQGASAGGFTAVAVPGVPLGVASDPSGALTTAVDGVWSGISQNQAVSTAASVAH